MLCNCNSSVALLYSNSGLLNDMYVFESYLSFQVKNVDELLFLQDEKAE